MAIDAPERPEAAPGPAPHGPIAIGKATVQRFLDDQMTDRAAALTYYSMMSLFPALFVVVALLGLLGTEQLVQEAVDYAAEQGADAALADAIEESLRGAISRAGDGLGAALVVGIAIAAYGASGAFAAAGRALNKVHRVEDDRGFVRQKAENLGWTMVVVLLAIVTLISVFLGGGIAEDLFGRIGLGEEAASIWNVARWPVALACALLIYAVVYAFAPDVEPRRLRWITPGAVLGVGAWILATIGFTFYVRNFGSYGATYGAFAAAVILLLWLWITNLCLLLGAELNAVLERSDGSAD
ncbi:MAG: YihY/virulence factor BrkB family protein [Solirubrobacteraceae bacterium]